MCYNAFAVTRNSAIASCAEVKSIIFKMPSIDSRSAIEGAEPPCFL
jgi:hypothetical protein